MNKGLKDASRRNLYYGKVIDNVDPLMLGRIRAEVIIKNQQDIELSVPNTNVNNGDNVKKWSENDPFVVYPLLPYFLYQVPSIGELVQIMYANDNNQYQDIYYIQGTFSSPVQTPFEQIEPAKALTGLGPRIKQSLPIRNVDGTIPKNTKGIFPEPGDNALMGRGTADVIIKRNKEKGEDTVLIRAGKTEKFERNTLPVQNVRRAFSQVSQFQQRTIPGTPTNIISQKVEAKLVKKIIEWQISNPENGSNSYSGNVVIYTLPAEDKVLTNSFGLPDNPYLNKVREYESTFNDLSMDNTINFINNFIKGVNDGKIPNGPQLSTKGGWENEYFPLYVRPASNNYKVMVLNANSSQANLSVNLLTIPTARKNLTKINKAIKFSEGQKQYGNFLMSLPGVVGIQKTVKIQEKQNLQVVGEKQSVIVDGADKIYLLSHGSKIPGKEEIILNDTLYGIPQEFIENKIEPNTSSMVRGEELLQLLNYLIQFVFAHSHDYHNESPNAKCHGSAPSKEDIDALFSAAKETILNTNIRLN